MRRFSPRRLYGEGPLHLLLLVATFCLAYYAGVRLLDGDTVGVLLWFAGSAVLHDLVLLPVYAGADRALRAALGPRQALVNFVRVPAVPLRTAPADLVPADRPADRTAVRGRRRRPPRTSTSATGC